MPGKDGLMLARAIRADATLPEFPLIMLTSGDSDRTLREARAIGINQYVRKPVRQSDLYECVLDVLGMAPGAGVPRAQRKASAAGRDNVGGKILLAEDNLINQEVARAMLELAGCTVEIVDNGRRAVERVFEGTFDVVLMDCQMPELDGYEAAAEIRRQETLRHSARRMPIVAITAHALQGDREKCIDAGMDDYITKPLQMAELRRVLTRLVKSAAPAGTATLEKKASAAAPPMPQPLPELPQQVPTEAGALTGGNPAFNRSEVLKRCLGDEQLMASLMQVFVKQADEDLSEIRAGLAGGDAQKVLRATHRLKGSSANISLERIRHAALALETHVRENGLSGADSFADALRANCEALVEAVSV
jgi:CheY-like chemotaxis protein/HPt (histidine-containing phosphotransfer) domain-containing protein